MWWWAVVTVLFWNTITSQPITDEANNDAPRHPRQLDFVHCCPCPSPDLPDLSRPGLDAANGVARAAPMDDCPCRSRGSDTQGESSVFFPRAVPFRPFVNRPEVQKEDQKPLLHPEVDLASSMLETLREVTDEEYQDALARDAARNAARVSELGDVEPETAKKLVTIIVNPRDNVEYDDGEVTPESSNVQETRCAYPSGAPHLGQARDSTMFKLQSTSVSKASSDMDDGASEVKENVFDLSKGLEGLKFKTTPQLSKLFPPRKSNDGNIQSLLKLKNDKLPKPSEDSLSFLKGTKLGSKIPNLKLTPLFKNPESKPLKPLQLKPLPLDLKNLKLPTLRTNLKRKPKTSEIGNTDAGTSPSNLQEHIFKPKKDVNIPTLDLKSLLSSHDLANFSLKKLLNLKDVELVPPKSNEQNKQIPGLGFLPPLRVTGPTTGIKKSPKPCKGANNENGEGVEVRSQKFQTEILDTLPHASENHPVFATSTNNQLVNENTNIKTQILDVLPSASENTNFVAIDKEIATPTAPSTEIMENINEDQDLEQHAMEESEIESSHTLPKHNTVNISEDDSSLEFIIEGDEDTQIDAVEFIEESEQPLDEIGIGGVTFNNNGQAFDLDFVEDTSSINGEQNSPIVAEGDNSALGFFGFDEEQEAQEFEDGMSGADTLFREKALTDGGNVDFVSNEGFNTLSENVEDGSSPTSFGGNLRSPESHNEFIDVKAPKPNSDLLSSLKERISLKLETLKNPEKSKILTISRISAPDTKEEHNKKTFTSEEVTDFDALTEDGDKNVETESSSSNQITIQEFSNTLDSDILTEKAENFSAEDKNMERTIQELSHDSNSDAFSEYGGELPTEEKDAEMETGASSHVTIQDLTHVIDSNAYKDVENFETKEKSAETVTGDSNQQTVHDLSHLSNSDALIEDGEHLEREEKATEVESNESNQVMQDLSRLSDSLLTSSQTKLQESHESVLEPNSSEETSGNSASCIENKNERNSNSDMESSATTLNEQTLEESISDIEDHVNQDRDIGQHNKKEAEVRDTLKDQEGTMNSCPCTLTRNQDLKGELKAVKEDDENEMSPQASENMFNTAAQPFGLTPFLRQSIVQPSSLFDSSSLLPPVQPLDLSNLNLPTLEDLTSGLGLLGGNARASDGISSTEFESAEDCSEAGVGMATGASKAKSTFAPLKPLEDINLDIFQINPLSQSGLASKMPSLNLNSFKTKLSLPPLGLKPLKLESSLGRKNGGLLGASLTFGPEKLGSSKKTVNKLSSILNRQGSDILGNSLASMPSLEELRSTMRANTKSLLGSPLITLENPLMSSQDLGESLRSRTENTMRNLQQSLASTFSEARSSGINNPVINNKFANPQELMEKVTLAHEDMNDKLHAIHLDLQDRLSSIHDRIFDQSQLPALRTPLLGLANVQEEPSGTWRIANKKNKPSSTRSHTSRITTIPKKVVAKKSKAKVNKPKPKETIDIKPFKISKAASSLTPKSVEVPKLVTSSLAPPFLRPLQRDNSLKLREMGSNFSNEKPKALTKQFKPFGDFKITIETTPKPSTKKVSLKSVSLKPSTNCKTEQKPLFKSSQKPVGHRIFSDSRGFASEPKPSQVPAPVRPATPRLASKEPTELRSNSGVPSSSTLESKTFPSRSLASPERIPLKTGPTKLTLPKPTESPLVTKMREAIKIRLSRPVPPKKLQHIGSLAKPLRSNDMTKAASENNAVVLRPEPMKENVSYKCKMVCVRD